MAKRRFSNKPPAQGNNRKALQLCKQVERALGVSLEGEILRDLMVQSVQPAPDSSRLLVVFAYRGLDALGPVEILAALDAARAGLRGAIAAAIHRKKTPELAFQIVPG